MVSSTSGVSLSIRAEAVQGCVAVVRSKLRTSPMSLIVNSLLDAVHELMAIHLWYAPHSIQYQGY